MRRPIDDFKDYIVDDILGHIQKITTKRLFGGYGVYFEEVIFGIITSDTDVYFKVDDSNREKYKKMGSYQFVYTGHKTKKSVGMPYWSISEEMMEDRDIIEELVYESAAISAKG